MLEGVFITLMLIIILPFRTVLYWLVLGITLGVDRFMKRFWITTIISLIISGVSFYVYSSYNPGYLHLNQALWPFYAIAATINALFVAWLIKVLSKKFTPRPKNTSGGES